MKQQTDISVEHVPIDAVTPHPRNVRVHTSAPQVRESLQMHGQYAPIVVQRSTGYVLAGNGLWQQMHDLGFNQCAVTYVDVDEEQALRILLVDNETSDRAGYDEAALAALLASLPDLQGTGWTEGNFEDLRSMFSPALSPDDLADQLGDDPDPAAFWPVARIPLPPDLYQPWISTVAEHDGIAQDALRALMEAGGKV